MSASDAEALGLLTVEGQSGKASTSAISVTSDVHEKGLVLPDRCQSNEAQDELPDKTEALERPAFSDPICLEEPPVDWDIEIGPAVNRNITITHNYRIISKEIPITSNATEMITRRGAKRML